jgi:hypothetical protein
MQVSAAYRPTEYVGTVLQFHGRFFSIPEEAAMFFRTGYALK